MLSTFSIPAQSSVERSSVSLHTFLPLLAVFSREGIYKIIFGWSASEYVLSSRTTCYLPRGHSSKSSTRRRCTIRPSPILIFPRLRSKKLRWNAQGRYWCRMGWGSTITLKWLTPAENGGTGRSASPRLCGWRSRKTQKSDFCQTAKRMILYACPESTGFSISK